MKANGSEDFAMAMVPKLSLTEHFILVNGFLGVHTEKGSFTTESLNLRMKEVSIMI